MRLKEVNTMVRKYIKEAINKGASVIVSSNNLNIKIKKFLMKKKI